MHKTLVMGAAAIALFCASCSPAQVTQATTSADTAIAKVQTTAAAIDPKLVNACSSAMALVPLAALAGPVGSSVAGYATAGCSDAEKIATLAADPTSAAWAQGLVAQMAALIPQKAAS